MKTVEEKADEFLSVIGSSSLGSPINAAYEGYIAGYNEAMRWISVEEDMPEHKKLVLVKGDESGDQIPFLLGWYYGPHWFIIGEEDISFGEVTHWKPISL